MRIGILFALSLFASTPALACIDINAASEIELQKIVHIDVKRAAEIARTRQGRPFAGPDQLVRIKGIGAARIRDILDQGLACVGSATEAGTRERVSGAARVLDADTFEVAGVRVRLIGIDAPEGRQQCQVGGQEWACGTAATEAVTAMVGTDVACDVYGRDRWGRALGVCYQGGDDINAAIVRAGWALAWYPDSGAILGPRYDDEQAAARAAGVGIWQSRFVEPWVWRAS